MNERLFKSVMVANGDTQETLAKAMGIGLSTLNAKIKGTQREFRQNEIDTIKTRYKLTPEQVTNIFFST